MAGHLSRDWLIERGNAMDGEACASFSLPFGSNCVRARFPTECIETFYQLRNIAAEVVISQLVVVSDGDGVRAEQVAFVRHMAQRSRGDEPRC